MRGILIAHALSYWIRISPPRWNRQADLDSSVQLGKQREDWPKSNFMRHYELPEESATEAALKTASARASYYCRRAAFFEGALEVLAMGVIDDCPTAAKRVLEGAGKDYFADEAVTKPRSLRTST